MIPGPPTRSSKAAPKARWGVVGTMLALSVGLAIPFAWGGEMVNDPNGWRGIEWGQPLSQRPDLQLMESVGRQQHYEPVERPPRFGDTAVESLRLVAIEDQFARVTIRYHGQDTQGALMRQLEDQYGPAERLPGSMLRGLNQQFTWRGPYTEVNLTYDGERERGSLFIESRTLAPWFLDSLPEHAF